MPSCARKHQLLGSLIYHVFNRANARAVIFHERNDYVHFLNLIHKYGQAYTIKVYHWVIMSNHYHLLLEIEEPENIPRIMAGIHRAYTHYYHKKYATAGFLWQGRYKLQPIQRERYLVACGRYIERNPVRAGIVEEAEGYEYSSAKVYCNGVDDKVTTTDPLFSQFGSKTEQRRAVYRKFLKDFNRDEEESFASLENPLGDKEFLRRLIKENGRYVPRRSGKPPGYNISVTD